MYITAKQRAIIDRAVNPCYITSNYLGTDLQKIVEYYCKFYLQRRFFTTRSQSALKDHRTKPRFVILFNGYIKRTGFCKKYLVRRTVWQFHRIPFPTKYGRRKYRADQKRQRRQNRRQKRKSASNDRRQSEKPITSTESHKQIDENSVIAVESSSASTSNSVEQNVEENRENSVEKTAQKDELTANHNNECDTLVKELPKENHSDANADSKGDELDSDEAADNLFNLPLLEVSTLMTEGMPSHTIISIRIEFI